MSNSLSIEQVADNQNNKETTINTATVHLCDAMTATLAVDLTSADATLSAAQNKGYVRYKCTGHSVARNLNVTAVERAFIVTNGGTGAVTVVMGSGSVLISVGTTATVYTDGTANGITVLTENSEKIAAYIAGTPTVSVPMFTFVAARNIQLPIGLVGSSVYVDTGASGGTVAIDVQKNGASVGTITLGSGVHTATFTMAAAVSLVNGDRLSFVAPSNMRSASNIAITLAAIQQ